MARGCRSLVNARHGVVGQPRRRKLMKMKSGATDFVGTPWTPRCQTGANADAFVPFPLLRRTQHNTPFDRASSPHTAISPILSRKGLSSICQFNFAQVGTDCFDLLSSFLAARRMVDSRLSRAIARSEHSATGSAGSFLSDNLIRNQFKSVYRRY